MQGSGYNQGYYPPSQNNSAPAPGKKPPSHTARRKRRHPVLWLIVVAAVILAGVGGFYYQGRASLAAPYKDAYLPNISIDGIALTGKTKERATQEVLANIRARQNSWSLSLTSGEHTFITLDYELMGITTDENQALQLLDKAYAYGRGGGVLDQAKEVERLQQNPVALYTTQTEMTASNVDAILVQLSEYFDHEPTNAYLVSFNPAASDPFIIQPEIYGASLATEPLKQKILEYAARGESGKLEVIPTPLAPTVFEKDVRADVTLLSEGITAISKSSEEGRTQNIRIACDKINGTILEPGEEFSFNKIVGKRTVANGFQSAPEYAYGTLVPGIGGGVCQTSTTVYIAAVTSNLKINKRTKHSVPVNYTDEGQDATVSDGRYDFVFSNNTDGNIYITAKVDAIKGTKNRYQCIVRVYGKALGEGVQYKLRSVQTEKLLPGPPKYVKDKDGSHVTYTDETKLYQKSREGSVVETYLQRWENGVLTEEHLITTDRYEPREEAYYVGTKTR